MKRLNWGLIGVVVLCLAIVPLAGCVSKSDYEALQAELQTAQSDLTDLQADYDTLNANYQAASNELAQIKRVYPLEDFPSLTALEDWLLENDVSEKPVTTYGEDWYGRALEVQEDALADGYLVSADYDYDPETDTYLVWCVAIINGRVFFWDPETDEVFEDEAIGTVK